MSTPVIHFSKNMGDLSYFGVLVFWHFWWLKHFRFLSFLSISPSPYLRSNFFNILVFPVAFTNNHYYYLQQSRDGQNKTGDKHGYPV